MSNESAKNRAGRQPQTEMKTAKPSAHEHQERLVSMKVDADDQVRGEAITKPPPRSARKPHPAAKRNKPTAKAAKKRPPAASSVTAETKSATTPGAEPRGKKGARQTSAKPAPNKRGGRRTRVGRADGPLARRRRLRIRLLLVLLLVVNVAAGIIWRDWQVTLAVFIVSIITAPLVAAALLRRR